MGAFGLAKQINISNAEAKEYIERYFSKYSKVKQFIEYTKELAKKQGFVSTIMDRKLYLADINSNNKMLQNHALRAAINAPMQGSCADIIKKAMIDIDNWQKQTEVDFAMLLQVHDELLFEALNEDIQILAKAIQTKMEQAVILKVPLEVSVGIADNWGQAH